MLKKKIITFFVVVCSFYAIPCFGVFSIDRINDTDHTSHYNSLPFINQADSNLRSRKDFSSFLEKAEHVVVSHGFQDTVGLRLIHRHFDLKPGQVMVETYREYRNTPSLITTAYDLNKARAEGAIPSSWIFNSQPAVFELTTDSTSRETLTRLESSPTFFPAMKEALEEFKLENLLAVAILKRGTLLPQENEVYLERNFSDLGQSVVQISPLRGAELHIRTSWGFYGPMQNRCYCTGHYCEDYGRPDHTRISGPHNDL